MKIKKIYFEKILGKFIWEMECVMNCYVWLRKIKDDYFLFKI